MIVTIYIIALGICWAFIYASSTLNSKYDNKLDDVNEIDFRGQK